MACKVYHGYFVLLSTFILRFSALGIYFIFGSDFIVPLRVSFGVGAGPAALFPSIYSSVALLIVVLSGYVQDQLTHRGYSVRPVFLVGSIFVGVGSLGASYSRTFPGLLVNSIVMGAGIGGTGFGASGILAPWFTKRSGTFLLLGLSGGGVGGFTYALVFEYVLQVFHEGDVPCTADAASPSACEEWRPATRYVGIASAVIMFLASIFMRLPKPGEVEAYEAGVHDHSSNMLTEPLNPLDLENTSLNPVENTNDGEKEQQRELSLKETLKTKTAICILCWSMAFATGLDSFFVFVPSYAESVGLSSQIGALALSLTGVTLMIGNLTLGIIADKFGHDRSMQMCMLGLSGACIAWPFCRSAWSLLVVACLVGYFMTCTSLFIAILTDRYGHVSKGCILTLIGLMHAVQCPGLLIGPVITGFLLDQFSFYAAAFFTAAMFFVSAIAVLCLPSTTSQADAIATMLQSSANS